MHGDILTIKYDNDGEYLALGAKNGTKILYNLTLSKRLDNFRKVHS